MWFLKSFRKYLIIVILFIVQANTIEPQKFLSKGGLSALRQNFNEERERPWRLPNTTYPLEYHLHITTWIHKEINEFLGHVSIELQVKESTSELVLHAIGLKIKKISVQDLTAKQEIKNLKSRSVDDLLVIDRINGSDAFATYSEADIFMKNHRLRLEISFSGIINPPDIGRGFSMTTYDDERNKTIYGAYTFMQPTHARTVLPCYDEPALKAKFIVRITHGSNYTAISNMPAISSIESGTSKMTTTSFMKTPLMSTYLLAFVVSNFKFIAQESDGILHRVFFPPNSKNRGDWALKNAIKVMQAFSQYMDVPYSLPKLDHVAIKEFAGGMENWGLSTYRSKSILNAVNSADKTGGDIKLQNHEIVHQWLGNLVSPAWWDSTWLSEGFAVYYSYLLKKMTNSTDNPNILEMAYCFNKEYYNEVLPVIDYAENPIDIRRKNFGSGVYFKSPCIIRMFEHAFGEPIFRKGLSNYLKSRAFSTANETHLYDHLQSALLESTQGSWNYSVHEIMSSWLHAKTSPIVTITRDYENSNLIHIQQRASRDDIKEFWWVPLNFATTSQQNLNNTKAVYYMPPIPAVTLNLAELNITLNSDDWLVANIQCMGYYRVEYDEKNMQKLKELLKARHSICCRFNCPRPNPITAKMTEEINQS